MYAERQNGITCVLPLRVPPDEAERCVLGFPDLEESGPHLVGGRESRPEQAETGQDEKPGDEAMEAQRFHDSSADGGSPCGSGVGRTGRGHSMLTS